MKLYALLAAFLIVTCNAFAQTPSAGVVGRITDPSGAVVPGVAIKITNLDTNISQRGTSNESGDFNIPFLNPGRYVLEASATGFRTHKQAEFALVVDQLLRLDIKLEVGAPSQTVTVTGEPPVLNTESSTRGAVTSPDEIKQLPLDGRNFSDLALLTGGVIPKADGADGSFAVNGARADNGGFLLDGMNNTQRRNTNAMVNPPIEGIQEFKMITSGYSAEYGRFAGGMLTVVTKSGTNRFSGSLYEFVRNDKFDAIGYFDVEKSKLRHNQFGATLTGPVYIPKLYDGRNRTFFMFTSDFLREIRGQTARGVVPTPEMLRGDFSKATDASGKPITLIDSLTKKPFANNYIDPTRFDPVAVKIAKYFPPANLSSGPYNFIAQGNGTTNFNNFGAKVDHTMGRGDRLTFSTFLRRTDNWDPVNTKTTLSPLPLFGSSNPTTEFLTYIKYLKSITPRMFLEASFNYSRRTNNEHWPYSADKDWSAETGFVGGITNPIAAGPPLISITNFISLGPVNSNPKIWAYNNYQYAAGITWLKGRHAFKFGGDFLRAQYFSRNYGDTRGRATFQNAKFTGYSLADFMLGWANSTTRQLDAAGPYHLVSSYSGYLQDDFKAFPSLTLNLGVRYELQRPPHEKFNALAMFLPSLGKIVIAGKGLLSQSQLDQLIATSGLGQNIAMASDVGLPETIVNTNWTNFAPRFGFAWRVFGNAKTVLRGGYGIFYGTSSLYRMDDYASNFPFATVETYSRVSSNPLRLTLSNPFPADIRKFSGVNNSYGQTSTDPKPQYLQSWNLTIEREFWSGTVIEIAYAGSKGTHLPRRYDINQPGRTQATSTIRPYPLFNSIQIISDGSNSNYHSGQANVRRRFGKQLFVRASYTWAKSIDENSNTGGTLQYNFSTAQDSNNLWLERGRSDFDIRHAFSTSFIWTPQFSKNWLLRDWQISGTGNVYSGPPFTPRIANFTYSNGEASRPDRIASGKLANPTPDRWYDVTAFPVVPTGSYRFGSSGRNILDGPGTIAINTSLSRRIRVDENRAFQFRLELFNLPNHPNFGLPDNNVDVTTAGAISTVKNNRSMQLALRFEF